MAKILERAAAARLERPDGAGAAEGAEDRRQSADLHGQPALLQGSAGQVTRRSCGMSARFEPVTDRYMHIDLFGRPHRIYVEEAGEGTPLLCLHTAGSDGRQYRGLMNDTRVTAKHRIIAFDMPWHGKSSPPSGWHDEEYQLTSVQYTTMVLEIMAALELEKPILIGCSIGGRIAPFLALQHPHRFPALIGLQAGAHIQPYYDPNLLHPPGIHGGQVFRALRSPLVAAAWSERQRP